MLTKKEDTRERIEEDLQICETMAGSMSAYLDSEAVYYPLSTPTYPKLTLGNYLMRQQRLLALSAQLDEMDKGRLETAVFNFNLAINNRVVKVEQKSHEEAGIRLRQWQKAVSELKETPAAVLDYYSTMVTDRVKLTALFLHLQQNPYQFDEKIVAETTAVDHQLSSIWQPGDFVWPNLWKAAYPQTTYWWLYGRPSADSS